MPEAPKNPDNEFLVGLKAIGRYMGRDKATIYRWIHGEAFPAGMLPCGHWIASKVAIREWIRARGRIKVDNDKAPTA